jgi:hypothetical protein
MSTITSFAELASQHAEPLPARTVMSIFQAAPPFLSQRFLAGNPPYDYTCLGLTTLNTMGTVEQTPSCQYADAQI